MYIINKVKGILNRIAVNKCYNIYISYSSGLLDLSHLLPSFHAEVRRGKTGMMKNRKFSPVLQVLTASVQNSLCTCAWSHHAAQRSSLQNATLGYVYAVQVFKEQQRLFAVL